jgi:hypothetical protein
MKSYANIGLQGYNSTSVNYGTRVISNTLVINSSFASAENVRFTFGGTNYTFEITWYEYCIFAGGTSWTWWGDLGGYITSSGTWSNRFGATVRTQAGTNNGVGGFTNPTSSSLAYVGRTGAVSQNIQSIYFLVHCDRWDLITITYG